MHRMTTERGKKHVIDRLLAARNIFELEAVWASVGIRYQHEPQINQLKKRLKAKMEGKR
jgi:hypothetical protein